MGKKALLIVTLYSLLILIVSQEINIKSLFIGTCDHILEAIKSGKYSENQKIVNDCLKEPKCKQFADPVDKCYEILPMRTPEEINSTCSNIDGNLIAFGQVKSCMENLTSTMDLNSFQKCCENYLTRTKVNQTV